MGRALLRAFAFDRKHREIGEASAPRMVHIWLTAAVTTAVWAGILSLGSWAAGIPVETGWFTALLAVIFMLLILGLSTAATASRNLGEGRAD